MSIAEYLLLNYRWIFIFFYLLPVSVFCDICCMIKNWLIFKLYSAPNQHDNKVKNIQRQINQWNKSGQKLPLCITRTVGGFTTYKNNFYNVKMNLLDILKIDKNKETVLVEPLVTLGQLTSTLLPLGWTLPILPSIEDLTVGGLVMGCGFDSSSHNYGLFQNICKSFELVLGDGSLVKCSRDENSDLFFALPWSYGTLGFLTAVEIQMIPAYNFVKLHFKAYHNKVIAMEKFLEECGENSNDFVEGLLYNENQCMIITGQMVNHIEGGKLNEIGKWYKPWFYQHAKSYFTKGSGVEYIPLKDYYQRHTRSTYWELQDIIPFGNNIFFRIIFGWAIPPKITFFKYTQAELVKKLYKDKPVMLDIIVPDEALKLSVEMLDSKVSVYPVWLCPVSLFNQPGFVHSKSEEDELFVNLGIYGVPKSLTFHPEDSLKELEEFVKDIGGYKLLYGDVYITEEEFREVFDHSLYDNMRKKLNCEKAFPNVYEKMVMMKSQDFCDKKLKYWF